MRVNVSDAKSRLSELLRLIENGEAVTICRRGVSVAELVPPRTKPRPWPGMWADRLPEGVDSTPPPPTDLALWGADGQK